MILTKREILNEAYKGYNTKDKTIKRCINKILNMNEIDFIEYVNEELKWRLEPIRKNTYILT